jgi:hypothetical protein
MRFSYLAIGIFVSVHRMVLPVQAETGQQKYERAETALAKGDSATATELFADLALRMQKSTSLSKYQLLARYGDALLLNEEAAEAAVVLEQALDGLNRHAATAEAIDSVVEGLALSHFNSFEYARAAHYYTMLIERLKPKWSTLPRSKRQEYQLAAALAAFWSNDKSADIFLDAVTADIDPATKDNKEFLSYIESTRARFALTRGDKDGAAKYARQAMKLAGGITTQTSLTDRTVRQDAALVAWFRNEKTKFIEYTGMSGAARLGVSEKGVQNKNWLDSFSNRVNGTMPPCATSAGVTPNDVVVIEFAIGKQGQPVKLQPIYSSNWGKIEKPFLQAAQAWSFSDSVVDLSTFWRESYRVALRCQTASADRPSALMMPESIRASLEMQSTALGLLSNEINSINQSKIFAKILSAYNNIKAERPNDPALGPLLFLLLSRGELRTEKADAYMREFSALTEKNLALRPLFMFRAIIMASNSKWLKTLIDEPEVQQMSDILAFARAKLGLMYESEKNTKAAEASYQAIIDSPIAAQSPYRLMALLHLASIVQKKEPAKAAELFKATSLQPDQCALYDVQPVVKTRPSGSAIDFFDFYFESRGWVHTEMDISATGKSEKVRVVASYPPFLYEAGAGILYRHTSYQPIFRGNGEGCKGYSETQSIIFTNRPLSRTSKP